MRVLVVAAVSLLACAAPAGAAFQACTWNAGTVTATFGGATSGTLSQTGAQILADGVQCGGIATTANTDTINVVGTEGTHEALTLDLAGGRFLGGATDEPGASDEVEINLALGPQEANIGSLYVWGAAGGDHVTTGRFMAPSERTAVNLNADEADGVDADVLFDQRAHVSVYGLGGDDVLSAMGGAGIPERAVFSGLDGGDGDDDLASTGFMVPGPGVDAVRFPVANMGDVSYHNAGPVKIRLQADVDAGPDGGTEFAADGHGSTDVYFGDPGFIQGSINGSDTFNGSVHDDWFDGLAGAEVINGGGGADMLRGDAGVDTIHGDGGDDTLEGGQGNDALFGDAGDDTLDGTFGDDQESGGEGDDVFLQWYANVISGSLPDGADDMTGGAGTDTVEYGTPTFACCGGLTNARVQAVRVDLDGVADDGADGEGDNVRADVENLTGGRGDDTLVGDGDANVLRGFHGADTLIGGDGDDTLAGLGAFGAGAAGVEAAIEDGADTIEGGGGADLIDANEGDDAIAARDGVVDTIFCGPGTESGTRDADDVLTDCETALEAPPSGGTTPPPAPPASVPPASKPGPVVNSPLPKAVALVTIPSAKRCVSRRRLRLRVKRTVVGTVRSVEVFVDGRRRTKVNGRRIGLPVNLRGLPRGTFRVRLKITLADGRTVTDKRTYRTCRPKRRQ